MRKWIIFAGLGLAAAAAGTWLLRPAGTSANETAYRTATVDRGRITASVRATGTLTPVTTVLVGSMLSGQIVEILVDFNSQVKAGQVVARLDATQFRTRRDAAAADLAQAKADRTVKQAQLERAKVARLKANSVIVDLEAQRDRVSAQLADAKRTFERQNELFTRGTGARQTYDSAQTQVDIQSAGLASIAAQIVSAKAELGGLDADIALAEGQVQASEATISAREAKLRDIGIDLERTEIRSPVDGVVVQRQVDLGQTVAASLSAPVLFQIAQDLRTIDIYANIDEADVGRLKPGQRVSFTVNAYPGRTFEGRVELVRLGAQTIQNVVTYTGVVRVSNRDAALLPGMTANIEIVTEDRPDVLRVPNAALRFRPPGALPLATATPSQPSAAARGARALAVLRERIDSEVKPTPEQAQAIDAILERRRGGGRTAMAGLSPEERQAAFRTARQELLAEIAATLDPERRALFEALGEEGPRRRQAGVPGRVYVLDAAGEPQAVQITTGPSDGAYTEVLGGELASGAIVVTGGGPGAVGAAPAQGRPIVRGPRLF